MALAPFLRALGGSRARRRRTSPSRCPPAGPPPRRGPTKASRRAPWSKAPTRKGHGGSPVVTRKGRGGSLAAAAATTARVAARRRALTKHACEGWQTTRGSTPMAQTTPAAVSEGAMDDAQQVLEESPTRLC